MAERTTSVSDQTSVAVTLAAGPRKPAARRGAQTAEGLRLRLRLLATSEAVAYSDLVTVMSWEIGSVRLVRTGAYPDGSTAPSGETARTTYGGRRPVMGQVDVGGQRIAYRETGAGAPLILLHGWPGDSRQWWRQLEGLSDQSRVVAWDAPGAGESSDPAETSRLSDWADWLAEFIEILDLGPADVAGLSFGGGLALELFRRHPGAVRSLILISAYAGWRGSLPAEEVRRRLELTVRNTELPPAQWIPDLIDTLVPDGCSAELVDELATVLTDFHPAATRTALRAFAEADLSDALGDVDVPTLLLYGDQDVRAPREVWEPIHARIPQSRLVLVPDVGHMVPMEAAARCNTEIRAFIRQVEEAERRS